MAAAKKAATDTKSAKKTVRRGAFRVNENVVYPAHGVGRITAIEAQVIVGVKLELFVIEFEKERMTLRVPTKKAISLGMRKISDMTEVDKTLEKLKGRPRVKRTMWSRRAQEYESKINSGDIGLVSEVVRDLYRAEHQPEPSYSERQLYEAALDRLAREVAVAHKLPITEAKVLVESYLAASPHRKAKAAEAKEAAKVVDALTEEAATEKATGSKKAAA